MHSLLNRPGGAGPGLEAVDSHCAHKPGVRSELLMGMWGSQELGQAPHPGATGTQAGATGTWAGATETQAGATGTGRGPQEHKLEPERHGRRLQEHKQGPQEHKRWPQEHNRGRKGHRQGAQGTQAAQSLLHPETNLSGWNRHY